MQKKDKDAFLRSITGTKPIQKKDNIKKSIITNENLNTKNIKTTDPKIAVIQLENALTKMKNNLSNSRKKK